jgi:predicted transcriptional regulator
MNLRGFSMPEEFSFLCMLHNIGAVNSEKSLTTDEISKWTFIEPEKVKQYLRKLLQSEYISMNPNQGTKRYYVTSNGIRKVLSTYS